jgi:parallel beta-helix repeat protein
MQGMRRIVISLLVIGSLAYTTAAWEATTSQNVQIKVSTQTSSAEDPGPSAPLYASPPYSCVTNWYVSTTGSDTNNGQTPGTAWKTIQRANNAIPTAGTCINIAQGLYPISGTIVLNHGGSTSSPGGYVVYRSTSLGGAHLQEQVNTAHLITLSAGTNYVMFDGLELDGHCNGSDCTGGAYGDCLDSTRPSGGPSHHIWAMNNTVHDCGQSGIQLNNSEWFWILHNLVYNNSYSLQSGVYGSGISVYDPEALSGYTQTSMDQQWSPYQILINYNVVHDNHNIQPCNGNTDGNGIILDDWVHGQNLPNVPYVGNGLVLANIAYHNGGKGIHSFFSQVVTIANNTAYDNNWDTCNTGTYRGEINIQGNYSVVVENNIAWTIPGAGVLSYNTPFLGRSGSAPADKWISNISYGANNQMGEADTYPNSTNKANTNPMLVNPAATNFGLQSGSPAIGYGQTGTLLPPLPVDAGACRSSLSACP